MNWAAYFQENGGHRWTIAVRRFKHTAEHHAEQFKARIPFPEVGVWWVWVEETNEELSSHPECSDNRDASGDHLGAERDGSQPATDHPVDDIEPGVHGGS